MTCKVTVLARVFCCYWTNMTKSELIEVIAKKQPHFTRKQVDAMIDSIVEGLCQAAINNERVEIRGFGVFTVHHQPVRVGRNPKTGQLLDLPANALLHFKPGKELRERVNASMLHTPIIKEL